MNNILYDVCSAEDPWEAFVNKMPEEHKRELYCKAVLDAIHRFNYGILWDDFYEYSLYYRVIYLLVLYGPIKQDQFIDYLKLISIEERVEYARDAIGKANGENITSYILRSIYPTIPVDKLTNDDRVYTLVIEIALKNGNMSLFREIINRKRSVSYILPVLRNYINLIPEALEIMIGDLPLDKFCELLTNSCSYISLKVFIPYICKLRGISVTDYFIESVGNKYTTGKHIKCFGLTEDEIREINTELKNKYVDELLNK